MLLKKQPKKASFDLGLNFLSIKWTDKTIKLANIDYEINLEELKKRLKSSSTIFYSVDCEEWIPIKTFSEGKFFRLVSIAPYEAPTLEISGIHMHNIAHTTPWRDSERKVEILGVEPGQIVLDICTGLGYTAIHARLRGASKVVTLEKSRTVLKIAEANPWSRRLEDNSIEIINMPAEEALPSLPSKAYDKVLHDPPRFALAGELYSQNFYAELYRVLRVGGMLFHYTGAPKSRRGLDIQAGIIKRLKNAGFEILRVIKGYAILARKVS